MKYTKLPKRFKNKWVKALESGEYRQAKDQLYDGYGYCCLGVAACIMGTPKENIKGSYLGPQHIGIPSELWGGDEGTLANKLSLYNDGDGLGKRAKSFKWIASYIKRYL